MKIFISVILVLISIISIIVFAVDYIFYLKNRYCRFHIGRWDRKSWEKAVYKKALKWAKKTPTVKITDNSRYMLLDIIAKRYRSQSIQSWQTAALLLAVYKKNTDFTQKIINKYINENGNWKNKPSAVDSAMLSYSILKATDNPLLIKPAMDYMLNLITESTDENHLISYAGGKSNPNKYVDTLGLVCPFLVCYSKTYNVPEFETLAVEQLGFFHKYALYNGTSLPNHAINSNTKLPLGVYGWGRGVAWYSIGLIDTYSELSSEQNKSALKKWIYEAAENYRSFQNIDGGFGSTFQRSETYDSSATAVMAYFYLRCYKIFGNNEYYKIANNCLEKLKSVTRITGAIDWCQGDTKDIGIFAQHYDIMPFAQGFTVRALELTGMDI